MPDRPISEAAQWAHLGLVLGTFGLDWAGVLPWWMNAVALVAFFAGSWWISRQNKRSETEVRVERETLQYTPETLHQQASGLEYEAEVAEHERVEAVLMAILAREKTPFTYQRPMGGHMDKREGTYTLAAPLRVTVADLSALNGPLTRFETTTATDGRVSLTRLVAVDRHYVGIEVYTPRA